MRRVKILEVCAVSLTVKNLLLPLIDELIKVGYDVEISCTPDEETRRLENKGYKFRYVQIDRRINLFSNLRSLLSLYKIMKKGQYDIVHVHTPLASVLGRIAAKLARVPIIVYTAHGFYFHGNMNKLEYKIFVNIERIMGKYFTDYIFTQSEEDYEDAIKLGIIEEDKIAYISNGVDIERFNPKNVNIDVNIFKSSLGIPLQGRVVTFIGRLVKEKGILDLLNVFERLSGEYKDIYLVVVGDTLPSERDQETKERIKELLENNIELRNRVFMLGYREDIPEILKITDIFVLPSYREGLPRSIIEAMAMEKPVVAYNIRGCREEVVDGITGYLVELGDLNGLYLSLKRLLDDLKLAKKFGVNGRKRAEELYDERKVIKRQIEIFRSLFQEIIS